MQFLTVSAGFHGIHHNILRRHKRQFGHQTFFNDFRIYDQTVHYVQTEV